MKKSIILVLSLVIVGSITYLYFGFYQERDNIFLYIRNESFDTPEIDLQISIDDSILIDSVFKVAEISTYYFNYQTKLNRGKHTIVVKSKEQNLVEEHTFEVRENKHIFIVYNYSKVSRETYKAEKEIYGPDYPLDSIIIPKRINISSRDKIPLD